MSCRTLKKGISHPFLAAALLAVVMMVFISDGALAQRRPERAGARPGINLNNEQRQKLQRHIKESREKTAGVTRELVQARTELFKQLHEYKVDENRLQESVKKINGLQVRLHNIGLENQLRLRSILRKAQFTELGEAVSGKGIDAESIHGWPSADCDLVGGNIERLNITSEQQGQIKRLFEKSRATVQSLGRELREDAQSLHRLYLDYDLDPKEAKTRIEKLGETQREAIKATVARQLALREILTRQQFETLSQTMRPPVTPRRHRGQGIGNTNGRSPSRP